MTAPGPMEGTEQRDIARDLRTGDFGVHVELRPPRAGLSSGETMDAWIDSHHAIRKLIGEGHYVFLTDDAVGASEEESLSHLTANLGERVDFGRLVPFLTCKHPLDYCLLFAKRAASQGIRALVVVGGDRDVGPPRCVEHAYQLRARIREAVPELRIGGWANPHRDPVEQVGYMTRGDFHADFYLTQIVSHHSLDRVEAFLREARRRSVEIPGVFGVFFYRSANRATLSRLGEFFPVPDDGLVREFGEGVSPEEVCARTVRRLRDLGVENVYLSNLPYGRAHRRLREILREV